MTRRDDAYSPLKAVRHLDIVQDVRAGKPARPAHVQLILSDLCNQACSFCAYRDPSYSSSQRFFEIKPAGAGLRRDADHPERNYNPNRLLSYDKALQVVEDCAEMGVSGIQLTGGGEPTVHPGFVNVLREIQRLGMASSLVTNGVNVGKRLGEWLPELLGLSWVRFSLDAGRPETYKRIRNVPDAHWSAALTAIRELSQAKHEAGRGPVIGVGFVVTPDNWREVMLAATLARDLGADNIRISAQFSADDEARFADFHEECAALCRDAERISVPADGSFTVFNRFGAKLDDLRQRSPEDQLCGYQTFTTYVGADETVYRCCVLAYNDRGIVGSIKDQRFRDLWMSQARADEMSSFDARGCERCQFHGILKTTNYLLDKDDPEHSEFV